MKKKIDLSLICCYNNTDQLNNILLKSYYQQSVECELILVDNTKNKYSSAASALNHGAKLSSKSYFVFLYQDICFLGTNSLEELFNQMVLFQNSIIGVAGVIKGVKGIHTSVLKGKEKKEIGIRIQRPVSVFTLDECLIGCHRDIFKGFDETNCDNWHLYGVDLCLSAHLLGHSVYCLPSNIWHVSNGNVNKSFFQTLKMLKVKYNGIYEKIETYCIHCSTSLFSIKDNLALKYGIEKDYEERITL